MANKERNYFDMFVGLTEFHKQAINFLQQEVNGDFTGVTKEKLDLMHEIEHQADVKKHSITEKLVKEFVTPIEREDIMQIANNLDEVTDRIEELYQKLFMLHIVEIRQEMVQFLDIIERCVDKIHVIYMEFHNFKKSKTISDEIIALNLLEEDGDLVYLSAVRRLYGESTDPIEIYKWTTIFEHMEKCCDICEEAGNLVEEVIMKNS